jgi:hypothetical protein
MQWESVAPCLLAGSIAAMSVIQSDAARAQSSHTAFTKQDLENHGVVSVSSLASQTPPVGIYVDDVYYPTALVTQLENFQGVEQT